MTPEQFMLEHPAPSTYDFEAALSTVMEPAKTDDVLEVLKAARNRYDVGASQDHYSYGGEVCAAGALLVQDEGVIQFGLDEDDWPERSVWMDFEKRARESTKEALRLLNETAKELYRIPTTNEWDFGAIEFLNQEDSDEDLELEDDAYFEAFNKPRVLRCYDVAIARRAEQVA